MTCSPRVRLAPDGSLGADAQPCCCTYSLTPVLGGGRYEFIRKAAESKTGNAEVRRCLQRPLPLPLPLPLPAAAAAALI